MRGFLILLAAVLVAIAIGVGAEAPSTPSASGPPGGRAGSLSISPVASRAHRIQWAAGASAPRARQLRSSFAPAAG